MIAAWLVAFGMSLAALPLAGSGPDVRPEEPAVSWPDRTPPAAAMAFLGAAFGGLSPADSDGPDGEDLDAVLAEARLAWRHDLARRSARVSPGPGPYRPTDRSPVLRC